MYPTTTATLPPPPPPGPDRAGAPWTRRLLAGGAIAGPLFVLTFVVEGATRAHYSALRHPVSSLELGDAGWVQRANFVLAGLLTLAFAVGLRRTLRGAGRAGDRTLHGAGRTAAGRRPPGSTWGPVLVGIWAVGLIGAGLFATDPVSGYPPGTPARPAHATLHGAVHDDVSLVGFVALVAACFVFCRRFARRGERAWAVYSAASAVVFAGMLVLATVAFAQTGGLVGLGGLFQRVMVGAGWAWLTLLALRLRSAEPVRSRTAR
jgi:hypothetical protein